MTTTIDWSAAFAHRAERMQASEIRELLKLLDQPDILSFAGGIPDPKLFPVEEFRKAQDAILSDPALAAQALQYSVSEGHAPLRQWIVGHMQTMGVDCTIDNIMITAGSQQGLDFLGKLFLSPGDTALVCAPTYLGALQAFNPYEPTYDTLRPEGGNDTAERYRARAAEAAPGGRVRFAYLVPDFANPTGETLSIAGRRAVLKLAEDLAIPVFEDAAYRCLRYSGEAVKPILALDCEQSGGIDNARTVYAGTFSKTLAPAFRIGWLCGPAELIRKLVLTKQAADLHCSPLAQMTMQRVATAIHDSHVAKLNAVYAARRDALLQALKTHMPEGVRWTEPEGGLFIWVDLPAGFDGAALLARALAEEKVAFVPGKAFYGAEAKPNTIRLNFSLPDEAMIDEGMRRLGRLIKRQM